MEATKRLLKLSLTFSLHKITKIGAPEASTIGRLQSWLQEAERSKASNQSMSFIPAGDCVKIHANILELKASPNNEHQRCMSLIEGLHWNDILKLYQKMAGFKQYNEDDMATPTQFNLDIKSLSIPCRNTKEALKDSIEYL